MTWCDIKQCSLYCLLLINGCSLLIMTLTKLPDIFQNKHVHVYHQSKCYSFGKGLPKSCALYYFDATNPFPLRYIQDRYVKEKLTIYILFNQGIQVLNFGRNQIQPLCILMLFQLLFIKKHSKVIHCHNIILHIRVCKVLTVTALSS